MCLHPIHPMFCPHPSLFLYKPFPLPGLSLHPWTPFKAEAIKALLGNSWRPRLLLCHPDPKRARSLGESVDMPVHPERSSKDASLGRSCTLTKTRLLQQHSSLKLMLKPLQSPVALNVITFFTDGSGKSQKSVITWQNPKTKEWESDIEQVEDLPQIVELAAVIRVFSEFAFCFSSVTVSFYVTGVVERAEGELLKTVSNNKLYN